jgi:hypothetical protein
LRRRGGGVKASGLAQSRDGTAQVIFSRRNEPRR